MKIDDAVYIINEFSNLALIAHIMPDGDTLGSCLALKLGLERLGKQVVVYCQDPVPSTYEFIEGAQDIETPGEPARQHDLVICVDCSDKERLGLSAVIFDNAKNTINIDHHISNTMYAGVNIVDPKASATGELIYELLESLGIKMDKAIAEALYTAIATDTGSFCYSSTTARTHQITAQLLEYGVEVDRLSTILFKQHSIAWTRLLGKALDTLELYLDGRIAVIQISKQMIDEVGAQERDTSGIINYAKEIDGVEVAILLTEHQNMVKVGLRSQSLIDVSRIAQQFGGGGHMRAAGCSIHASLEETHEIIIRAVKETFNQL